MVERAIAALAEMDLAAEVERLRAELAEIKTVLASPIAVHLNMLRGGIAKPSFANIKHLYRDEFEALLRENGHERN